MASRIEIAEVLSFRLKIAKEELEKLLEELQDDLPLTLEADGAELVLGAENGDSHLRFRAIGPDAILTEVAICNDDRGLFFQRALGTLMVRGGGDLHVRVTWNVAEWNTHGEFAEVRVTRGASTYPGLGRPMNRAIPTAQSGAALGGGAAGAAPASNPEDPAANPEIQEILDLLARARQHWEEYQRLKAQRSQ
jgi:hypothetical protein